MPFRHHKTKKNLGRGHPLPHPTPFGTSSPNLALALTPLFSIAYKFHTNLIYCAKKMKQHDRKRDERTHANNSSRIYGTRWLFVSAGAVNSFIRKSWSNNISPGTKRTELIIDLNTIRRGWRRQSDIIMIITEQLWWCRSWWGDWMEWGPGPDQNRVGTGWAKKVSQRRLHITSSNTVRFSKFFHCHILLEICNKAVIKYPTSPQTCCHTTLWNTYVSKLVRPQSVKCVTSFRFTISKYNEYF